MPRRSKKAPGIPNTYKFVPETAVRILRSVKMGAYTEVAAAAAGISKVTLLDWLRRGARKESPELTTFAAEYAKAEAEAEVMAIGMVTRAAAKGIWQAAAWRLERKHPERWGRREKVEHSGPDGGPVEVKQVLTSGEKRAELRDLARDALEQLGDEAGDKEPGEAG